MSVELLSRWVRHAFLVCLGLFLALPLLALGRIHGWSWSELGAILARDLELAFGGVHLYPPVAAAVFLTLAGGCRFAARWFEPRLGPRRCTADASAREILAELNERLAILTDGVEPRVVDALNEILESAVLLEASDIHLTPAPSGLELTFRVDGRLTAAILMAEALTARFATRVKVLSRLDPAVRRKPQDGRLDTVLVSSELGDRPLSARVSTLPTERGERVVLRLVAGTRRVPRLDRLGLTPAIAEGLRELLAKPEGLLFVTGPVGSGKTTTLYAALEHVHRQRAGGAAIVTLEDPVEQRLDFATQTQIEQKGGVSFAAALRSVLRQDPNVLMVGEIRDRETAEIAMQAGLTGHLILTTVHGHGAAGAFARLQEMNIEGYLLASASLGALSQRLVRRLCDACKAPTTPDAAALAAFEAAGLVGLLQAEGADFHRAVGCPLCEGSGYEGRLALAELLVITPALAEKLTQHLPTGQLRELARQAGMRPLLEDGLIRARAGETTLEEVLGAAG